MGLAILPSIRKLICFGRSFKNPNEPEDQRRTDPLMTIEKPFLIIQGKDDQYGQLKVPDRYQLSDKIEFALVKENHEYAQLEKTMVAFK